MTETQRTLAGYKSKVHEQGEFENPNEGKPLLSEFEEYVFRLTKFPHVKSFSQIKDKADGTRATITTEKAICEFEEEITHNIATAFFRVDSLNFSEDESFESGIIRFFKKIGTPLIEGVEPDYDKYFVVGMRFRGRVVVGKDADKNPNRKYYIDVPTCRPILASDKHPEAVAAVQSDGLPVENIRFIVKGAKTKDDGMMTLVETKQSVSTIQNYLAAVASGKITFPV